MHSAWKACVPRPWNTENEKSPANVLARLRLRDLNTQRDGYFVAQHAHEQSSQTQSPVVQHAQPAAQHAQSAAQFTQQPFNEHVGLEVEAPTVDPSRLPIERPDNRRRP